MGYKSSGFLGAVCSSMSMNVLMMPITLILTMMAAVVVSMTYPAAYASDDMITA